MAAQFGMGAAEYESNKSTAGDDLARRVWEALPTEDREAVIEERVARSRSAPGFADPALVQRVKERLSDA